MSGKAVGMKLTGGDFVLFNLEAFVAIPRLILFVDIAKLSKQPSTLRTV